MTPLLDQPPANAIIPGSMDAIRLFLEIARCHSFSQAAASYGVTQSAASQRIAGLEKALGVTLIDRSTRPLTLTAAGKLYREGVEDVLARLDRVEAKVTAMREDPEGEVRVAAIYSAGMELLGEVGMCFEKRFPRVHVRIDYDRPERVHERVRGGEADLGILSYPGRWRGVGGVGVMPLREEEMAVVCAPDHAIAARRRIEAVELSPFEMVGFERELPVGRAIERYLKEHAATPRLIHSFDNLDTIRAAVAATRRLAILPRRSVARDVAVGTLAVVELVPRLVRPLGVIYRGGRGRAGRSGLTPPAAALLEAMLAHEGQTADMHADLSPGAAPPDPGEPAATRSLAAAAA